MSDFPIAQQWLDNSVRLWFACGGDQTLGMNFDHLNEDSLVMEVGGYHGGWAKDMFNKYNCEVNVYEPVEDCYNHCINTLGFCEKVYLHDYGLSDHTGEVKIYLDNDGSSMVKETGDHSIITVVDVLDEIDKFESMIDLVHLNIEGAEYDFLERILDNNYAKRIRSLLVQFHYYDGAASFHRRQEIQSRLAKTHTMSFNFDFVWERWDIKE